MITFYIFNYFALSASSIYSHFDYLISLELVATIAGFLFQLCFYVLTLEILLSLLSGILLFIHDIHGFFLMKFILALNYVNDIIADAFYCAIL